MVGVKMKKSKCVIDNINVKKSWSTFLGVRNLTLIPVYQCLNPAGYFADINFLLTVWYQIIVKTKMIVHRVIKWNYRLVTKKHTVGFVSKCLACHEQDICQFCYFSLQILASKLCFVSRWVHVFKVVYTGSKSH